MTNYIQVGNEGVKIVVTVTDENGTARNLTGATQLKIKLRSVQEGQTVKSFTAVAENLSAGQLSYTLATGDVDIPGKWYAQAYYELGAWKGHTKPAVVFTAENNLV